MSATSNQTVSFQCPVSLSFNLKSITNVSASVVPTWISLICFNIVTLPPTVLINFLIIWTVLEKEQFRCVNYNLLVAVLSLNDLLVGLIVQPLYAALGVCIIAQCTYVCELTTAYVISAILCAGWTGVTMAILSLERYIFIEHPLYYHTSVTSKKLMMITAASWIVEGTIVLTSRLLLMNNAFWMKQLPGILMMGSSFVIVLFCAAKINLTAIRQMRVIAAQQQSVLAQQSNKIKEYKRAFTLGFIVLASVACLCLVLILKFLGAVNDNLSDDFRYVSQIVYLAILNLQSLINPIIYSLRLSDIRSGVSKKLYFNRQAQP